MHNTEYGLVSVSLPAEIRPEVDPEESVSRRNWTKIRGRLSLCPLTYSEESMHIFPTASVPGGQQGGRRDVGN